MVFIVVPVEAESLPYILSKFPPVGLEEFDDIRIKLDDDAVTSNGFSK